LSKRTALQLLAGRKSSGEPVHEEVLVDEIAPNRYRVAATPGFVLGIAAGDVIEVSSNKDEFRTIDRGGNLAVHLYGDNCLVDDHLKELAELSPAVDGRALDLTVLTISLGFGFDRVEQVLDGFCHRHPGIRWYYGNVYDPTDGVTPLNWWVGRPPRQNET